MTTPRRRFRLSGPSITFDPRRDALRADLADLSLAGQLFTPHYAQPVMREGAREYTAIYDKPGGEQSSELLHGEGFALLDIAGEWAWGYSIHDHYVGYVKADTLALPSGATAKPEYSDPVAAAQQFLGMTYLWGGRGGAGIDCSGLIQRGLAAAAIAAPRDSDMQQAELGLLLAEDAALKRGDLIFFPGHVGMMIDAENLLHATRHRGKTVIEPLVVVIARVAQQHETPVTARKRIA